jgi:mannose-6-phosphate isomerase-like protein (cupin superfamily)
MNNSDAVTKSRDHGGAAVLTPGEGETIEARGNKIVFKAIGERQFVADYTAPAGFAGPPLHVHPGFDETFIVLDGTLTMRLGEDVHRLGPGGSAYVAGDVPHTFANEEVEPVNFLVLCAPGGFERYFRAVAAGEDEAIAAAAAEFGYEALA